MNEGATTTWYELDRWSLIPKAVEVLGETHATLLVKGWRGRPMRVRKATGQSVFIKDRDEAYTVARANLKRKIKSRENELEGLHAALRGLEEEYGRGEGQDRAPGDAAPPEPGAD
jgi:hypothetical protein